MGYPLERLPQQQAERDLLAQLNLQAGKQAQASAAYVSAFSYLQVSLANLALDSWETRYSLTLEIYSVAVELAYLSGEFAQMEQLSATVLHQARSTLDTIKVYEVKVQALLVQGQPLQALQLTLQILALLEVSFPLQPGLADIQRAMAETQAQLAGRTIAGLINLPAMTNQRMLAAMQLLSSAIPAAHAAGPLLFPLIVLKQVQVSVEYGNAPISPFSYAVYGLLLCGMALEINYGYQFSQLALQLMDRLDAKQIRARVLLSVHAGAQFWKEHLRDTFQPLQDCYQAGLDSGDLDFAGITALHHCDHAYFAGLVLPNLTTLMAAYRNDLLRMRLTRNADAIAVFQQAVLHLTTATMNPGLLSGEAYDEVYQVPLLQKANDRQVLFLLYLNKLILCYLFQDHDGALAAAQHAATYIDGVTGQVSIAFFRFYDSLACLAAYSVAPPARQRELLSQVAENQALMQLWATHAPMNYLHKWQLVEAEQQRVLGNVLAAMEAYDGAIALAKENQYLQEEALANELAARFYLERGKQTIAKAYLQEARYAYLRWGATAKVHDLDQRYPSLPMHQVEVPRLLTDTTNGDNHHLETLDLITVLKASQAIASEIVRDTLLDTLMTILIEHAGAQTGYLAVLSDATWRIAAIGAVGTATTVVPLNSLLFAVSDSTAPLPISIINYVAHTRETIVLDHAAQEGPFTTDPWIVQHQSRSVLCVPLLHQSQLVGIIFLENNLVSGAFTPERMEILKLLSTQAAISITNTRLLRQQTELNEALQAEIDERERTERDRDRLIAILEASTDYVGISDAHGHVLWNNAPFRQLIGVPSASDISVFQISDYHLPWAWEIVQQNGIPTAIRDGTWVGETAVLDSTGREIPVSQLIIAHKTVDGQIEYLSTIMRDISARKAAEDEIRQLNTQLEDRVAQRTAQLEAANRELEAFSYSVSHDLRAPLRAIDGFSRLLEEDYSEQLGVEAQRYLTIVRENAKRMGQLIDDLLTLSRTSRQGLHRQRVDPNGLIQMVLRDMAPDLAGRQIDFVIADLPSCQADPSLLQQVWVNLLSNAIKYTRQRSLARIEIGYKIVPGQGGVYFISDNGAGFDMRYADKLFGVFQRLHRPQEFEGTGIGLALVQRILQRHGGTIWAEATIDQGATFFFSLPEQTTHD